MDGVVLSAGALVTAVSSYGANFFAPILATVEALAPWIIAVAGAIASFKLVKSLLQGMSATSSNQSFNLLNSNFRTGYKMARDRGGKKNYKQLRAAGVDDDDIPLGAFDYKERNRVSKSGEDF